MIALRLRCIIPVTSGARAGLNVLLLALLAPAALHAADDYAFYAWLTLEAAPAAGEGWTVTQVEGDTSTSPSPSSDFEPIQKRMAIRQGMSRVTPPFKLSELTDKLSALDAKRNWLAPDSLQPQPGRQRVLLRYRNAAVGFTVDVRVFGNDSAATSSSVPLDPGQGLSATHRATGVEGNDAFARAVSDAATRALSVAQAHGLVPGGTPGDHDAIRNALQAEFLLRSTDNPDYRPNAPDGQAIGLLVQPVAIPRHIAVELTNWIALEKDWDAASIAALRRKRLKEEAELRDLLVPVPRGQHVLVTNDLLKRWKDTPQARAVELMEDRYEGDTLTLRAVKPPSRQDLVVALGFEYDATNGLVGGASAGIVHEKTAHLELNLEYKGGADSSVAKGFLRWKPRKKNSDWTPKLEASAESRSNDRAYFGQALSGNSMAWEHWQARTGLTLKRDMPPLSEVARKIRAGYSFSALLAHTDDEFETAIPVADEPDTRWEIKATTHFAVPIGREGTRLNVNAHARFTQSIERLGGHYDGRVGEARVSLSYVTVIGRMTWKAIAETRAGRVEGNAPLTGEFRAGGDEGWIRGLREGELTGREFRVHSFAAGPLLPFLSGAKDSGRPPVYLLGFVDTGRVRETAGAWRSAEGYGVALNLDDMGIGGGKTAALTFGYAYSPASLTDRHGSLFVRFDVPLDL